MQSDWLSHLTPSVNMATFSAASEVLWEHWFRNKCIIKSLTKDVSLLATLISFLPTELKNNYRLCNNADKFAVL